MTEIEKAVIIEPVSKSSSMRNWNPFLRPDWRWRRIIEILDDPGSTKRVCKYDDSYIVKGKTFLNKWRKVSKRPNLQYDMPGPFFAKMLFDAIQTEPNTPFIVEAMLLADFELEEIAKAVHTEPPAIEWYEALFFNVRPRLKNRHWILNQVLLPAADRYVVETHKPTDAKASKTFAIVKPHFDMTLKFFSFYGGPVLCDFLLTGFKYGNYARMADDIGGWLDEHFSDQVRRRSAQAIGQFEINQYNVMELAVIHSNIIAIAKGTKGAGQMSSLERHIQAMLLDTPWTMGDSAKQIYKGTVVGYCDEQAMELRDDVLQLASAGMAEPNFDEYKEFEWPMSAKEGASNANSN